MKKTCLTLVAASLLLAAPASDALSAQPLPEQLVAAVDGPSSRQSLPASYREFKARCQTACRTPEGAVKMYFDAVFCYLDPSRRAEAQKMLRYIMHTGPNWERSPNYSTFVERLRNPDDHHIFRSFARGSSPANGYRMDPSNYTLQFHNVRDMGDHVIVNLTSSGADSPRMVTCRQYDDGLWYMFQNAGSYVQVRPPRGGAYQDRRHDADYDR